MAELIKILGMEQYRPKVIAIDKTYGAASCAEEVPNAALSNAFQQASVRAHIRLVVGQATHARNNAMGGDASGKDMDCLVRTPAFDFNERANLQGADRVQTGLTRLNQNTYKIPLSWWTFASDKAAETSSENDEGVTTPAESFSVQTAKQGDLEVLSSPALAQMFSSYEHPYARFRKKALTSLNAMDLLCTHNDAIRSLRLDCSQSPRGPLDLSLLKDKTIVVGEQVESDKHWVQGKDIYGVDLQAGYIDALLSSLYVQQTVIWDYSLISLFILGTFFIAVCERQRKITAWGALLWSTYLFAGLATVSVLLLEIASFFTPIFFLAWRGVAFLLITQLLLLILHEQIDQARTKPEETKR